MKIFVNQLGYLPNSKKIAILSEPIQPGAPAPFAPDTVQLCTKDGTCILEKTVTSFGPDEASGDFVWQADFSELTKPDTYVVKCGDCTSYPFAVGTDLYGTLTALLSKALYFQRCGTELSAQFAGKFARTDCHLQPSCLWTEYKKYLVGVLSENSLQKFDIYGGWHDAGDFGRYPTAASVALAHILYAYRFFPEAFTEPLNIPESGNGMPDILNECLYELRWMLQMQDAEGGIYHKQTTLRHADFIMPCDDKDPLLLFPVSSMAVADFAAIMALASRIYRPFDEAFAEQALTAALKSYTWLERHPEFVPFTNPSECNTGEYGDSSDADERMWATMELYRCTGGEHYLAQAKNYFDAGTNPTEFGWADVGGFAGWALFEDELRGDSEHNGSALEQSFRVTYKEAILREANRLLTVIDSCGYGVALSPPDYIWGSNMVVLNRAMLLSTAYLLAPKEAYRTGAVRQMDYLLGVNAVDYSYVTGVGTHAVCNPHNRVTEADGIDETIPGFVSGGPNGHPADELGAATIPAGTPPMKCFLDRWECYSLNEITIYWNSPAIFAAAFLNCKQ